MHITTSSVQFDSQKYNTELISSNKVLTRNVLIDIWIGIRMLFGGELKQYETLVSTARDKVLADLQAQAEKLGAESIIALKIETNSIHPGTIEVLAYGTALIPVQK